MTKEFTIEVDGCRYTLASPTARDSASIQDYLNSKRVDPVEQLLNVCAKLPENMREKFLNDRIDKALEEKGQKHNYKHDEIIAMMNENNIDFVAFVNSLYFKKYHPEIPADETLNIVLKYCDNDPEKMTVFLNKINNAAVTVKKKT